jgi:probable HAF family extracellular repeat protein
MRNISCAMLLAAVCGCGDDAPITQPHARLADAVAPRYRIEKLPSLGGAQSRGMAINNHGWVAGWSDLPGGLRRAVLWKDGAIDNLETLGGPSSTVPWPGLNDAGVVVGISHTNDTDPLDEDWACELGGFLLQSTDLVCRAFVWRDGGMRELPALGGNHGFAAGVNNVGEIVGWAETAVEDATCVDAQVLRFRAALWEVKSGSDGRIKVKELRPLGDDETSAATAINDAGQAVGISGRCDQAVGRFSALRAVLWEANGKPREIPNLGGETWHTPMDINAQGDVVGFSNPPGPGDPEGDFIARAFYWAYGAAEATAIGALGDDALSEAFALNRYGQVVGISFGGSSGPRGFYWENGVLSDLNQLADVAPDVILSAQDINDAGQITGRIRDAATGEVLAFVATPVEE